MLSADKRFKIYTGIALRTNTIQIVVFTRELHYQSENNLLLN